MNYTSIDRNVSQKYAKAFMAIFPKAVTFTDIGKIKIAQQFLQKHKQALLFLQLPRFNYATKKSMVADLISHFSLPEQLSAIMLLLITHNRSFYIPDVLLCINQLYKKQTNCVIFSLKSASPLHEKQIETVKRFLEKVVHKNIIIEPSLDKSLIAGLRLQSNEYVWEYSVRKHLQTLHELEK
ncbi:MAG TPA: ATP synthase F1 subunit delta [Candidatus Babeliales bacterium]|nr:ATP synthase F1 subunit delta [Candidatus Babeliales bacterium]